MLVRNYFLFLAPQHFSNTNLRQISDYKSISIIMQSNIDSIHPFCSALCPSKFLFYKYQGFFKTLFSSELCDFFCVCERSHKSGQFLMLDHNFWLHTFLARIWDPENRMSISNAPYYMFLLHSRKLATNSQRGFSSVLFPFRFPFQLHCILVSSGISSHSVQNILS